MRKFLSLVLALVMMMSLVTINAGAKEFTDDGDITYQEAVDVISTIKVVDGYENGSFNPAGNLTRGAAAKIICNLILGPTTAAELHADTAPFRDVAVTHDFAGYIAYCQKEGIISGYADGTFRPAGTLTGYAFMKMLLGALGYDAEIEGFVGPNWSINVAKKAIGIGLNRSLEGEFNGVDYITREEAALYSFNTLRTDLVEYDQKITASVNGAEVTVGNSLAKAQTWNNSLTRHNNIRDDQYIQFAEQYFNKLVLTEAEDCFGRPDREWKFDGDEIGTYINYDLFKQEYTTGVTGKDLRDLLGSSVVDEYKFLITIDGETEEGVLTEGDNSYFTQGNLVRTNTKKVGATDKGVLTQVFVDNDRAVEKVWIAVINTYLAKASSDYSEKREEAYFDVYGVENIGSKSDITLVKNTQDKNPNDKTGKTPYTENLTVLNEDIDVTEVKEDDLYLAHVAEGEIKELLTPEIMSEKTISNFKKTSYVTSESEQYDYADTALYDPEVLDQYDDVNMKNVTYDIIMDEYGYLIGLEINEDPDQYVFITGMDGNYSNLKDKEADMGAIFLDGTMDTIRVNTKDSTGIDSFKELGAIVNVWCKYTVDKNGVYTLKLVPIDGIYDDDGKQVSKVAQWAQNTKETTNNASSNFTIDKSHISLNGSASTRYSRVYANDDTVFINAELGIIDAYKEFANQTTEIGTGFGPVAGGKPGLNIAGDENFVNKGSNHSITLIIDDVDSVTIGAKNTNLEVKDIEEGDYYLPGSSTVKYGTGNNHLVVPKSEIYTLYNNDGRVIAVVTLGVDQGTTTKYAFFHTSDAKREAYASEEDEWTWTRDAIINGEIVELTEVGSNLKYLGYDDIGQGKWAEVKYDAKGNVRSLKEISYADRDDVAGHHNDDLVFCGQSGHTNHPGDGANNKYPKFIKELVGDPGNGTVENSTDDNDTVILYVKIDGTNNDGLPDTSISYKNGALWVNTNEIKGFDVAANVKTVLCLSELRKDGTPGVDVNPFDEVTAEYEGYSGLERAIDYLDANFYGYIGAVIEDGLATSIILDDRWGTEVDTGDTYIGNGTASDVILYNGTLYVASSITDIAKQAGAIRAWLEENGYEDISVRISGSTITAYGTKSGIEYTWNATTIDTTTGTVTVRVGNRDVTVPVGTKVADVTGVAESANNFVLETSGSSRTVVATDSTVVRGKNYGTQGYVEYTATAPDAPSAKWTVSDLSATTVEVGGVKYVAIGETVTYKLTSAGAVTQDKAAGTPTTQYSLALVGASFNTRGCTYTKWKYTAATGTLETQLVAGDTTNDVTYIGANDTIIVSVKVPAGADVTNASLALTETPLA